MRFPLQAPFLIALACLHGCGEGERPARVVFVADVVDLGVLDPGEVDFTVPFRNDGSVPLRVGQVSSTCSCTNAEATPEVGPAGSGTVRGKVKVQSGPGAAELTVATEGTGEPRKLRLKWFGKSTPTLVPAALDVRMRAGVAQSRQVEISYPAGDPPIPLRFVGVSGLPEGARVELIENNPAAIKGLPGVSTSVHAAPSPFIGKAKLRIDLPASPTPGSIAFECVVKFTQQSKTIELPFTVRVRSDEGLRCHPEVLLFSASDFGALKQIRRKAILTSDLSDDRFEVVEKPSYLDVQVTRDSVGQSSNATLTAGVVEPPPPGETGRQLVIENSAGRRIAITLFIGLDR